MAVSCPLHMAVSCPQTAKEVVRLFKFHKKEKLLYSSKKLSTIWDNLTLYYSSLPLLKKTFLFPSVWPSTEYTWHLVPYPNGQSRKRMMNTLLIISRCSYVSETFTKAKKSVLCAEYPSNELKIIFIQMENIFLPIY